MKLLILLFWITVLPFKGFAQKDSSFVLLRTYTGDIADAALDNLDNLYIISSTGQVKKYNAAGDSMGVFNGIRNFGKLTAIDVSNPLKLLLFYRDFSTIVILDRFLAQVSTLNLRNYQVLQAGAIGISYDNNIWVFDEYDNRLKKLDEKGNKLLETVDFRSVFNQGIRPQRIINDNGLVYLADTTSGIFVFDNYGSFQRKIPVTGWKSISIKNNLVISSNGEAIAVFNPVTLTQTRTRLPLFQPYLRSFTTSNRYLQFDNGKMEVFKVKL